MEWLCSPNPNGLPNSDILFQRMNANDLTKRYSNTWVIAFNPRSSEEEACLYEKRCVYAFVNIKPARKCLVKLDHYKPLRAFFEGLPHHP